MYHLVTVTDDLMTTHLTYLAWFAIIGNTNAGPAGMRHSRIVPEVWTICHFTFEFIADFARFKRLFIFFRFSPLFNSHLTRLFIPVSGHVYLFIFFKFFVILKIILFKLVFLYPHNRFGLLWSGNSWYLMMMIKIRHGYASWMNHSVK